MRGWFAIPLWKRVLGGLFLGLLLAIVWPQAAPNVAVFGDLFVRAIRMLVAPIVLVTIAAGITSLADPKRLGPLGGRTVGLFTLPTAIAASESMLVEVVCHPADGVPRGQAAPQARHDPVRPFNH